MRTLRWLKKSLCVAALVLGGLVAVDAAHAQSGGFDKEMATREGVAGSLGTKEFEGSKLPGPFKIGLGVGSIFVAVAAVKWL